MAEGGFKLHKWHSNIPELIETVDRDNLGEATYTDQVVGSETKDAKILGTPWNEQDDSFSVKIAECMEKQASGPMTKRKMLSVVNGIFNLLGIAAPVTIVRKLIYSEIRLQNLKWDEQVPNEILIRWEKWLRSIKEHPYMIIPRSVIGCRTTGVVVHGFSDASKQAVCAAIYALSFYSNKLSRQHLLVSKARVAPKQLTIPRLELVAAHMLSKLMKHVKETL